MIDNKRKLISAGIAVSGLAAGAMVGLTIAIRLKYGIDAPFEDFMPVWMSKVAYWINQFIPSMIYYEDGSFVIFSKVYQLTGCNPFGICN